MNPCFCIVLALVLVLVGTQQLPAPIREIPESPTPASTEKTEPGGVETESKTSSSKATEGHVSLQSGKDRVSYSIGLDIGSTLKRQLIDVNEELLNPGIQDGLSGKKHRLTDDQVKETMSVFQKDMAAKKAATGGNFADNPKVLAGDKASYCIGLDIGTTLKRQMIEVNEETLNIGVQHGLGGEKPLLNEDQVKETMATFQKAQMARQAAAKKTLGARNAAEGAKFLAANKTKEGVKTTVSGLQYKVLTEGSGRTPKATDTVTVNYRGTTIDGNEFDNSYKRGQPATFPVNRVIKGWTEALQLMKVGSKYQLFIPANLAYAERGAGSDIGPNATLLFDVELLGVTSEARQ